MMKKNKITVEAIEACLPQTQCGLCDYPGCKPYAQAIIKGEVDIDHCHPGGEKTLDALALLMGVNAQPMRQTVIDQQEPLMLAVIDKDACIGCTKCLPPCPVDAIVGARKRMHTVIESICTGCGLCIEPCPMDCITLVPNSKVASRSWDEVQAQDNKQRFEIHEARIALREKTRFAPIKK